jgi:drug/metabolite transporter (DMT)-like permease
MMLTILLWWITCLIWSSVWLFIKIGVTAVPPITFAGLRLALAVLVLAPFVKRADLPRTRREWKILAATGFILLGVNYALVFWGMRFIPSGLGAVLQTFQPAFGLLFASWISHQRITAGRLAAVALGVVGVGAIFADQLRIAGRPALIGAIAVTLGGACVAFAYVFVKQHLGHVKPTVLLVGQMIAASVPLLIAGFVLEGNPLDFHWSPRALVALVYLALAGSVAAFWLNYWLLKRTDASSILAMSIVEPLIAVALGALILHEKLSAGVWVGAACVLASIWFLVMRPASTSP